MSTVQRAYWRMQLHPSDPQKAVRHAATSLAAGFIGLDFETDIGDLFTLNQSDLPARQRDYWAFAHGMSVNDVVIVIAHHLPFAICRIDGAYNFIRSTAPELCVWFRHFRRVSDISYFGDFVTDAHDWPRLTMTDTISPLHDPASQSRQLIDDWLSHNPIPNR